MKAILLAALLALPAPQAKGPVKVFILAGQSNMQGQGALKTLDWVKRKWASDEAKGQFETMGTQPEYHYLGSARIFALIGHGLGEAMVKLCAK